MPGAVLQLPVFCSISRSGCNKQPWMRQAPATGGVLVDQQRCTSCWLHPRPCCILMCWRLVLNAEGAWPR
jgi:hypothetical protein